MNNETSQIKQEILVRIVRAFLSDDFRRKARLIPFDMRPKGMEVPYRCCVYKERAIIKDRVIAGLGFQIEEDDETVSLATYARKSLERTRISSRNLTVLQAACKGCFTNRIFVTDLCQGCVARPCTFACKFDAISVVNGKSTIDETKCKKCKMCLAACPYKAIVKITVPCEDSCPVGAIKKDGTGFASIDYDKCINCGRCVAACPFGAVHEKSQMIDVLKAIQSEKKVIAMIAPSIAGQFPGSIYQIKAALLKIGFDDVYEVAEGADITANREAKEFVERMEKGEKFMTTSCCAGYNQLIKKHLPEIKPYVSDTKTPMYYTAEIVKKEYPEALTVFISPCVAKRAEGYGNENVNFVLNYEELKAILTAMEIVLSDLEGSSFKVESSKQARNFGLTGGVAQSVKDSLNDSSMIKPRIISGLDKDSIKLLKKFAETGSCDGDCNLVEVMCCEGGCVGGNATIKNQRDARKMIDELAAKSKEIEKIK